VGEETSVGVLLAGAAVKGATVSVVRHFMDNVVTPYIRGISSKKIENKINSRIAKYAKVVEYKTRIIPTIATSAGHLSLDDVYEPLVVATPDGGFEHLVDGYPVALFERSRCVAVTDDAGMGKSTLAKYIVRRSIVDSRSIPLLIELRRLRPNQSIISCLCDELAGGGPESEEGAALIGLFERGNFIFVLDGFDEVEDDARPEIVSEINEISTRFQFCYFFLTSRPEYAASLFPEFCELEIEPLSKEQAYSLIRRFDGHRQHARLLIPKIEQAGVSEFLGNPLMVTLLYRAFEKRNSIPPKRSTFFRQVYDALFEDHDLSKGDAFTRKKECALDAEDLHKLLRALGFETFRSGRVSYNRAELLDFINAACARAGFEVDAKKVLQDLLKAVPIFLRDGLELKWYHKSFQEYFTAQYILFDTRDRREALISKVFSSPDVEIYREIFRFLGEGDIDLLRDICVLPYVEELLASAGSEADLPLASIQSCVDIFFVSDVRVSTSFIELVRRIKDRFAFDISERRRAVVWRRKNGFAIVALLKEDAGRRILLQIIDNKLFGTFSLRGLEHLADRWGEVFNGAILHINPDMQSLREASQALGGIEYIEAGASLHVISCEILNHLKESKSKRECTSRFSLLEEF